MRREVLRAANGNSRSLPDRDQEQALVVGSIGGQLQVSRLSVTPGQS